LFIHVIIPSILQELEKTTTDAQKRYERLWNERRALFGGFSARNLSEFHKHIGLAETFLEALRAGYERAKEVPPGIEQTFAYMTLTEFGRRSLLDTPFFFHLTEGNQKWGSDFRLLKDHERKIASALEAHDKSSERLRQSVESATEFVEARRNILESKLSVARSIFFTALSGFGALLVGGLLWWLVLRSEISL